MTSGGGEGGPWDRVQGPGGNWEGGSLNKTIPRYVICNKYKVMRHTTITAQQKKKPTKALVSPAPPTPPGAGRGPGQGGDWCSVCTCIVTWGGPGRGRVWGFLPGPPPPQPCPPGQGRGSGHLPRGPCHLLPSPLGAGQGQPPSSPTAPLPPRG